MPSKRFWFWLEQLRQDVQFSARALLKSRGFSITAITILALGIGANTAIFSLIDSVILKALPVSHPEQLLQVNMTKKDLWGMESPFLSNSLWEQLRDRQDVFSALFAYDLARFNLAPRGEAQYVQGNYTSGQFFYTLGLHAVIGRTFTTADDRRACPGTAVLSYRFWQREYGGSTGVVGKDISLDNHSFEILGVIGPEFTGVNVGRETDLYVPLCSERTIHGKSSLLDQRWVAWLRVIGRPKPGVSAHQAQARLQTLAAPIVAATAPPDLRPVQRETYLGRRFEVKTAASGLSNLRSEYQQALITLMVIVGVVLLIACANVANLLQARGAVRQREIAIRMALGSGRGRLIRQLLTESMMLSLGGATLGILFAHWGARLLVSLLSSNIYKENRIFLDLSVDYGVLAFTGGLAILTSLLFGLAPAWTGTKLNPQSAMKANAQGSTGGKFGLGKALVVAQVALSLLLVTGAGLMVSTFFRLETLNPGFDRHHILLADLAIRGDYTLTQRHVIFEQILQRLRSMPAIRSASYSDVTPLEGAVGVDNIEPEGDASKSKDVTLVYSNRVSGRFFETLGTDLLAGRDFSAYDNLESPKVAIVNQAMARKIFPGQNPIGKRYRSAGENKLGDPVEIIGLVENAKSLSLREEMQPTTYVSASQDAKTGESSTFELRAVAGSPASLISAARAAIGDVNRDVSLRFKTLAVQLTESLARERLLATLSGFFGGLALMLAVIGLYGLVSYNVTQRKHEIGIRLALGARQSRVLYGVLAEVAILIFIGLAIGVASAITASRFISSFLYGVRPNDPLTLFVAASLLAAVALLAGFLPARRASRLDPMNALREE